MEEFCKKYIVQNPDVTITYNNKTFESANNKNKKKVTKRHKFPISLDPEDDPTRQPYSPNRFKLWSVFDNRIQKLKLVKMSSILIAKISKPQRKSKSKKKISKKLDLQIIKEEASSEGEEIVSKNDDISSLAKDLDQLDQIDETKNENLIKAKAVQDMTKKVLAPKVFA